MTSSCTLDCVQEVEYHRGLYRREGDRESGRDIRMWQKRDVYNLIPGSSLIPTKKRKGRAWYRFAYDILQHDIKEYHYVCSNIAHVKTVKWLKFLS